jgi:hypothetical protein
MTDVHPSSATTEWAGTFICGFSLILVFSFYFQPFSKFCKCTFVFLHPGMDIVNDTADVAFGPPWGARKKKFCAISNVQPQIKWPIFRHRFDWNFLARQSSKAEIY